MTSYMGEKGGFGGIFAFLSIFTHCNMHGRSYYAFSTQNRFFKKMTPKTGYDVIERPKKAQKLRDSNL